MDQISDKKNKEDNWVQEIALCEALKKLPKREQRIIKMRFYEGKTQMEIAQEIHISQAQVSRLEKSALKTMKGYLSWDTPYIGCQGQKLQIRSCLHDKDFELGIR